MATDTDQSTASIHHTLGIRSGQASPGDHTHDGTTSSSLSSGYVTLGTNQTITGQKTFTNVLFVTGSGAEIDFAVRSDNTKRWALYSQSGNATLYYYGVGDLFWVTNNGDTYANGKFYSQGGRAGFSFFDEGGSGNRYEWYYAGGAARLWQNVGGDLFTVDPSGNAHAVGNVTGANLVTGASYTPTWYDGGAGSHTPAAYASGQPGVTSYGYYQRIGGYTIGSAYITVGSGGGITAGSISFDLPVAASGSLPGGIIGGAWGWNGGSGRGFLYVNYNTTRCYLQDINGNNFASTPSSGQQFTVNFAYTGV